MTSSRLDPLGLWSAPADIAHAIRSLPEIVERLDRIESDAGALRGSVEAVARDMGALSEVKDNAAEIASHAEALPQVNERIGDVAKAVAALPEMERRLSTIEAAMPALVEVQQHLARLPDAVDALGGDLVKLSDLLARMLSSLDRLDASVGTLHASVEPLGRIANRLPGGVSKRSGSQSQPEEAPPGE